MYYKIYFFDYGIQKSYPITIWQDNINQLARWINTYVGKWRVEVVRGEVMTKYHNVVGRVDFLPTEIERQVFLTTYEERLAEHYKYYEEGVVH
jgi:hypothetical protein